MLSVGKNWKLSWTKDEPALHGRSPDHDIERGGKAKQNVSGDRFFQTDPVWKLPWIVLDRYWLSKA